MSFSEESPLSSGVPSPGLCAANRGWDFRAVLEGAQLLLSGEGGWCLQQGWELPMDKPATETKYGNQNLPRRGLTESRHSCEPAELCSFPGIHRRVLGLGQAGRQSWWCWGRAGSGAR